MDQIIIMFIVVSLFLVLGAVVLYSRFYKIAPSGFALVRLGEGGLRVSFTRVMVFPIVHKLEYLDIRLKRFSLNHLGKEGVICRNNLRINFMVDVFMRVNHREEDVAKVAQSIGCERAGDASLMHDLFLVRFHEAIKTVTKEFDYEDIVKNREEYQHYILNAIGVDLQGFILESFKITHISLVNSASLDPNNILDAEGIRLHAKKLSTIVKENNEQEARLQREITETQMQLNEQELIFKNQKDEEEALFQANIRFLEEQVALDERIVYLEVKQSAEASNDIKKRLEKQIEEIRQKKLALKTQLELEEKSIKIRYQRKLLDAHRSDELPSENEE
ncbi:hypothetical protein BKI52_35940 [marine bacterium AO1-C]|nr:hypothetical protein BKI52_35940 [marine bacterium AO1-C]